MNNAFKPVPTPYLDKVNGDANLTALPFNTNASRGPHSSAPVLATPAAVTFITLVGAAVVWAGIMGAIK